MGNPSKFQRVSHLCFVTEATSLTGGQPNLARCLALSWASTLYIHLRGLFPLTEFCQVQTSLCVQVLRSPSHPVPAPQIRSTILALYKLVLYVCMYVCICMYIGSVTARHSSRGRQPKFAACYKECNCGTLADGATYIFGWAAITLGIGPYSNCV